VRAVRWQKNYELDDLWYNTPEGRQVTEIYNIEDVFDLRILFGLEPYEEDQAPKNGINIVSYNFLLSLLIMILIENFLFSF